MNNIIDLFDYDADYHFDLLDNVDGISLERINFDGKIPSLNRVNPVIQLSSMLSFIPTISPSLNVISPLSCAVKLVVAKPIRFGANSNTLST